MRSYGRNCEVGDCPHGGAVSLGYGDEPTAERSKVGVHWRQLVSKADLIFRQQFHSCLIVCWFCKTTFPED